MKNILVSLMTVGTVALAGWQMTGRTPASPDIDDATLEVASSSQGIEGTWFSLPSGLVLRFNDDGTAQFGVDSDGTTLGYDAQTWFEGTRLFVRFVNYDGESDICAAAGNYEVQVLDNGNLRFVDAQDDCQVRVDALQGATDAELTLEYSRVD